MNTVELKTFSKRKFVSVSADERKYEHSSYRKGGCQNDGPMRNIILGTSNYIYVFSRINNAKHFMFILIVYHKYFV